MSQRTGQCMCGAVKFTANFADSFGVCYCKMCQRWASGVFMGVHCNDFEVTEGADILTVFKSSEWANRGFCNTCGSNIYYHMPEFGDPSVALGSLDDTSGLTPHVQYFIDKKPEGFSLEQKTKTQTEAEIEAQYGSLA